MTADNGSADNGGAELSDSLKTFGAVLKVLREEAGLTQEELAPRVRYSAHYMAKIEQGRRYPPKDLPGRTEEPLGHIASRVLAAAYRSLTRRTGLASWFQHWVGIEEEALSLYAYECRVIPGLLQPEPYIREVFGSRLPPLTDKQLEDQIAARLERQRLLTEKANTEFGFIIEQSVIERRTGGDEVTRALIDHLLDRAQLRNVELQIMPLRKSSHAGLDGSMYLAETPQNQWVGYYEGHDSSNLLTHPKQVSGMLQRYGRMRSQALTPEASVSLLEQMRGAL
ncbi:helix-turn-helix domain-containing protein [Streptomyces chitinivorans]|uniref:Helix-turn-helix domain-containing protein n=1 Tax=Streptomyces chitinivorans TaxID=1257027 RepID=A0ABW7HLR4_9ACTN|nr:helix-turn-helix transcriptional regulator [Streptomyces chitinivorans]MDH2408998.1 helix-turn-helix transcriptional regulator [Streptomyces chitinivorans]